MPPCRKVFQEKSLDWPACMKHAEELTVQGRPPRRHRERSKDIGAAIASDRKTQRAGCNQACRSECGRERRATADRPEVPVFRQLFALQRSSQRRHPRLSGCEPWLQPRANLTRRRLARRRAASNDRSFCRSAKPSPRCSRPPLGKIFNPSKRAVAVGGSPDYKQAGSLTPETAEPQF